MGAPPVERAVRFQCQSCWLVGILTVPARPLARGVLIVTGGPQYRVGSHRQFVLLARELAARGIPVLRFDYRGMGDSEGAPRNFEHIDDDIDSAARQFFAAVPELEQLVLWGLCDGATAATLYAHKNSRIRGLILLNPWVRTESGLARATLRHYYLARLRDPDFWRKLLAGGINPLATLRSLRRLAALARAGADDADDAGGHRGAGADAAAGSDHGANRHPGVGGECGTGENNGAGRHHGVSARDYAGGNRRFGTDTGVDRNHAGTPPQRMFDGLSRFRGRVLIILSGDDLTAREFATLQQSTPAWRRLSAAPSVRHEHLAQANHTFSRAPWRAQVAQLCAEWLASW